MNNATLKKNNGLTAFAGAGWALKRIWRSAIPRYVDKSYTEVIPKGRQDWLVICSSIATETGLDDEQGIKNCAMSLKNLYCDRKT